MKRPTHPALRIAVVTGSRAEFGLLLPVMRAIEQSPSLRLQVVVAGSHLLPPARTIREISAQFRVDEKVPMQAPGDTRTRRQDAIDTGRGVQGFARAFARLKPDWVVVLGDRIEAFAAATAASIGGHALAHIHGGDRAEGIADEAMRHAISKLAHLHCAATDQSAQRLLHMGEPAERIVVTGSPAIDGLTAIKPMDEAAWQQLGSPQAIMLLHPSGQSDQLERATARVTLEALADLRLRVLVLEPNFDGGRGVIIAEISRALKAKHMSVLGAPLFTVRSHLPRPQFVALLKRLAGRGNASPQSPRGLLIGNSSAGLIEAAAIGIDTVNLGPRQTGRERGGNVTDVALTSARDCWRLNISAALAKILKRTTKCPAAHPYGPGKAGQAIAKALQANRPTAALLRKCNAY